MAYGVPEKVTTDGGIQFTGHNFQTFLSNWKGRHHQTSAYTPHSNLRAEVGIKSVKKCIEENVGPGGTLDTDSFARSLLQYRNTHCRFLGLSPAQILFARHLRDGVPCSPDRLQLRSEWILTAEQREQALAKRHLVGAEQWGRATREYEPLTQGTQVMIQCQTGVNKGKWDTSGVIVEVLENNSYLVKTDGSGWVTKRGHCYLKPTVTVRDRLCGFLTATKLVVQVTSGQGESMV